MLLAVCVLGGCANQHVASTDPRSNTCGERAWWCVWPAHACDYTGALCRPASATSRALGRCKLAVARSLLTGTLTCLRACVSLRLSEGLRASRVALALLSTPTLPLCTLVCCITSRPVCSWPPALPGSVRNFSDPLLDVKPASSRASLIVFAVDSGPIAMTTFAFHFFYQMQSSSSAHNACSNDAIRTQCRDRDTRCG